MEAKSDIMMQLAPLVGPALSAITETYEHRMRARDLDMQRTVATYKAELQAALAEAEEARAAAGQLPQLAPACDGPVCEAGGDAQH